MQENCVQKSASDVFGSSQPNRGSQVALFRYFIWTLTDHLLFKFEDIGVGRNDDRIYTYIG